MEIAINDQLQACIDHTKRFWDEIVPLGSLGKLKRYIAELLPEELDIACTRQCLPDLQKLRNGGCNILVLLVGHSFEPLLQAICAYQPQEVLLILNAEYGNRPGQLPGSVMYRRMEKLLPNLKLQGSVGSTTALRQGVAPLTDDTPSAVFHFLLEHLKADWETKSIVIDITGAKKSMVAGAFFFAAYTNTPISYVDFDYYDEDRARPYGCACRIGLISNPYHDFSLRDWAEVRRLYEQYAFQAAQGRLEALCRTMQKNKFFTDESGNPTREIVATNKLIQALEVYALWDSGNYRKAWEKLHKNVAFLKEKGGIPWAVTQLGASAWPYASNDDVRQASRDLLNSFIALKCGKPSPEKNAQPYESIFAEAKVGLLIAYVYDELAKVQRLSEIKEDHRAAFLRAVGLEEFLLKTRIIFCLLHGQIVDKRQNCVNPNHAYWLATFDALVEHNGTDDMRRFLSVKECPYLRMNNVPFDAYFTSKFRDYMGCYWIENPTRNWQAVMFDLSIDNCGQRSTLARLRGESIHTYLYVTQKIAEATVTLVKQSVDEFEDWIKRYYPAHYLDLDKKEAEDTTRTGEVPGSNREIRCPDSDKKRVKSPEWTKLCEWCGVDFLPPYRKEEKNDPMAVGRGS